MAGPGHLAMGFGYQRFDDWVMAGVVGVLIVIVTGVQFGVDALARRLDHQRRISPRPASQWQPDAA